MSNKRVVESKYVPREWAIPFHMRPLREAIMVCHRRAGKTVACINDVIDKAIQCRLPMPMYGYVAPFYSQAKTIAWRYLKYFTEGIAVKVLESELSVVLHNGAVVRLFGADNPDSLRGLYFDGVILDEYAQMQPRIFTQIIAPALVDRKGWIVFIGTPAGPNHFFEQWEMAHANGDWYRLMLKASESGIIPPDELLRVKRMMDDDEYRQEFECDFHAANRGAYYSKLINEIESTNIGIFPFREDLPILTAWDIGYSDDTSIWFFQSIGNNEFIIGDFFSESGYSVDDVLGELRAKDYMFGDGHLPHDAKNKSFQTGKSTMELLHEAKFRAKLVPSLSVQDGIQAVRKTLPKCYFNIGNEKVREGLYALRAYSRKWDDKKQAFMQTPQHDWSSHPADAFRMFALAMNPHAAKQGAQSIVNRMSPRGPGNVLCLDNLYRDRENRPKRVRI